MVYDCFSFFNELDLLEIRLNTLDKAVDRFVISESNFTHTGKPKPLYFEENKDRFAAFADKIIHVVSPDPETPSLAATDINYSWACENRQRNATVEAIKSLLKPDDTLIISDLDEIPEPHALLAAIKLKKAVRLRLKSYCYFINYRNCTSPFWYIGSVVIPVRDFWDDATFDMQNFGAGVPLSANPGPTASKVRALTGIRIIRNGGWHFSYLGGVDKIQAKICAIADGGPARSASKEYIMGCIESGNDIYGNGEMFFAEPLTSRFPPAVRDFPKLIFPISSGYLRKVRFWRGFALFKWIVRPLFWHLFPQRLARHLSRLLIRLTAPRIRGTGCETTPT